MQGWSIELLLLIAVSGYLIYLVKQLRSSWADHEKFLETQVAFTRFSNEWLNTMAGRIYCRFSMLAFILLTLGLIFTILSSL